MESNFGLALWFLASPARKDSEIWRFFQNLKCRIITCAKEGRMALLSFIISTDFGEH